MGTISLSNHIAPHTIHVLVKILISFSHLGSEQRTYGRQRWSTRNKNNQLVALIIYALLIPLCRKWVQKCWNINLNCISSSVNEMSGGFSTTQMKEKIMLIYWAYFQEFSYLEHWHINQCSKTNKKMFFNLLLSYQQTDKIHHIYDQYAHKAPFFFHRITMLQFYTEYEWMYTCRNIQGMKFVLAMQKFWIPKLNYSPFSGQRKMPQKWSSAYK